MPEIITRAEAKARGLKRYFTGKACGKGHVAPRMLSNGCCLVCLRLQRRRDGKGDRNGQMMRWRDRRDNRKRENERKEQQRKRGRMALQALKELGIEV